jgi:hypothetical protein
MPEEMMGVIPNSIRVPRLLASIIRSQYRGSEVSEDTIPYRGIWLMTKKMRRVNCRGFSINIHAESSPEGIEGHIHPSTSTSG